jgi:hypothetical protein
MVRFSTSSRLTCRVCGCLSGREVGHAEGCDFAASRRCVSDGVCVPDPAVDAGLEGALDEIVWLSRVKRREVMITWGTWYVLWRTCIAAARDLRSVIGMSDSILRLYQ